jgi:DNA polymerase III epsilon subunit-like protein
MYLFFDTETNGLPKTEIVNGIKTKVYPRVIQLAYILLNDNFEEVQSYCELIYPDGWEIPNDRFWIENGYSTEQNKLKGVNIRVALNFFSQAIDQCHTMVAHNIAFDTPVLVSEMKRYNITAQNKTSKKICTMLSTIDFCKLPSQRGGFKWPKLIELHEKLFNEGFDGAHDALEDVRATVRCFIELKNRNII